MYYRMHEVVGLGLLLGLALSVGGGRAAHAETVTFQQGQGGYSGCIDSWLWTWYGNRGGSATYLPPRNQHDNFGDTEYLDLRYYYSDT
ncbi:MAG: hypothetical protein J7M25_06690 [Deltaproteobacteria bacterium]|nr:hypothetical protein [Deltaproteobacteria bacterium]